MPELVKDNLPFEPLAAHPHETRPSAKERYLVLALTSLLAVNLVIIFGALTFYYLLIQR